MILDSGIKGGATTNKTQQKLDIALIEAIQQKNTPEVESCLEKGANPNQLIFNQWLIIQAVTNSNINIAELLIKYKVNLEVIDSHGNTPLLLAVQSEQMGMIKLLLANHANIDAQNLLGLTSLMYAAQKSLVRLTKFLCFKNPNLELKNNKNKTALDLANENGNDQIVQAIKQCQGNNTSKQQAKTSDSAPKKETTKETNKEPPNQKVVKKKEKKKKTTKEKIGPLKKLLIGFSQEYVKKYPPSSLEWSLKKKNQHAQEAYMSGVLPDLKETWFFQTLSNQEIQGDTGTNAFLPPESVENVAKNFDLKDFEAYVHYQPKQKLADRVEAIYKHLNYLPASYKIDVELESETAPDKELCSDYVMTYGHGTTEVFDTILEQNIKNKRDTIIVPTPTYGLFIPLMRNHCKIKTLQTSSENSSSIDPNALKKLIEKTEQENIDYYKDYFILKYSGLIQVKFKIQKSSDYEAFAKILKEINESLQQDDKIIQKNIDNIQFKINEFNNLVGKFKKEKKVNAAFKTNWLLDSIPRVRALYFINPSMPSGKLGAQSMIDNLAKVLDKHSSINIIEDVVHRGIVLDNNASTSGTFTKTSVVDRTLVLDGISKIFGLARARASILLGHRSLITPIAHSLHMRNCTLNGASNAFLNGVYKLTPKEFKSHLLELSSDYQKRFNLFKAVLFGQGDFSKKEFEAIKKSFNTVYKKERKPKKLTTPQKELIFSGIDNVKLYSEPEAGYFVLIDLSAYVGQYLGAVEMRTGMDFRNAFYNLADVNSLSDVMCYDSPSEGKAYIRYSLSIDSEIDMVEGLLRMKKVLAQCKSTAMEISPPKEKTQNSSSCKKGERKKSDKVDNHIKVPDILDKASRTLTLLKDTKDKKQNEVVKGSNHKIVTQKEVRGEKRKSPRFLADIKA